MDDTASSTRSKLPTSSECDSALFTGCACAVRAGCTAVCGGVCVACIACIAGIAGIAGIAAPCDENGELASGGVREDSVDSESRRVEWSNERSERVKATAEAASSGDAVSFSLSVTAKGLALRAPLVRERWWTRNGAGEAL